MTSNTILIEAGWIATVDPADRVLQAHTLVVKDDVIGAFLPQPSARFKYPEASIVSLPGHILIPGLINAHTHAAMNLFRGLADDLPLSRWLTEVIWPYERSLVDKTFVADGSALAIGEMLLSGTTCFNDMYRFPDVTAQVADKMGIRAMIGLRVNNFRTGWGDDPDVYFEDAFKLANRYRNHPRISTAFAPHAPYTLNDEPLERMRIHANRLGLRIHLHLHESKWEIENSLKTFSQRPLERLRQLGLLSQQLIAVHAVHITPDEINLLQRHQVNIVHCPHSNLKLGNGFCPVQTLLDLGINVALGTDSAASNNSLDMLAELHSAALISSLGKGGNKPIKASSALRMATIGGARALGLEKVTGSLECGKAADIVAINLSSTSNLPHYNAISPLVYSAGRGDVDHVWVAGKRLVENGNIIHQDYDDILSRCKKWQNKIKSGKTPR